MEPRGLRTRRKVKKVSIPYGKWNQENKNEIEKDICVSIPYGKWNQQQLVVGAIIAYKSMHVKGFLQKIYINYLADNALKFPNKHRGLLDYI
ncbi:MAG: hypothetical protein IKH21_06510 [Clostridia bacterium]|nr:hypothetical protein [Clostridia bacterium]